MFLDEHTSGVIDHVKELLSKSSSYYGQLITRKKRDAEIASGHFWNEDEMKFAHRENRVCKAFSLYNKYANAITSPYSKSPYHCEIEDPDGVFSTIQDSIDILENSHNFKYIASQAVRNACLVGTGFFTLSFPGGKIEPELVRDVSQVALDPNITTANAEDAEWGAIVTYIPVRKAKRLYGSDVVDSDGITSRLLNFGDQWEIPTGSVALVSFYELGEEDSLCHFTQICGNVIVKDDIVLPISRIPIFRVAFTEVVQSNKIDFEGIVSMTKDLHYGLNLCYSNLLERANTTPRANFMMPVGAIDGLEEYYKKLHTSESLVCLYRGDTAPTPIIQQFQTADIMASISSINDLISSTIGVPSQGITGIGNSQTATEILTQQANSESNVESLYTNTQSCIWSFTKTVLEALCDSEGIEQVPSFRLINGPSVITQRMKRRQELLALSSLVDEKTKTIIAKEYIGTLDADISEPLTADLIANSNDINWVSESVNEEDPVAVNTLNKMQATLDQAMQKVDELTVQNSELANTNKQLELQLMNMKEQNILELIKHQDSVELEKTKLSLDAEKTGAEIQAKNETDAVKLQSELVKLEKAKLELVSKANANLTNANLTNANLANGV